MFRKIPELDNLLNECLKLFLEVSNLDILALNTGNTPSLSGGLGYYHEKRTIFLFVPSKIWNKWKALNPIIIHELCHAVDRANPDRVFWERADDKSKKLWKKLKDLNQLRCSHEIEE